jgi:hypothetical protein
MPHLLLEKRLIKRKEPAGRRPSSSAGRLFSILEVVFKLFGYLAYA